MVSRETRAPSPHPESVLSFLLWREPIHRLSTNQPTTRYAATQCRRCPPFTPSSRHLHDSASMPCARPPRQQSPRVSRNTLPFSNSSATENGDDGVLCGGVSSSSLSWKVFSCVSSTSEATG